MLIICSVIGFSLSVGFGGVLDWDDADYICPQLFSLLSAIISEFITSLGFYNLLFKPSNKHNKKIIRLFVISIILSMIVVILSLFCLCISPLTPERVEGKEGGIGMAFGLLFFIVSITPSTIYGILDGLSLVLCFSPCCCFGFIMETYRNKMYEREETDGEILEPLRNDDSIVKP